MISQWPYSRAVFLPHANAENPQQRAAPVAGEMFRQADLLVTLQKLVDTEAQALAEGKTRKQAIYAAYDRFYRGDIAAEIVRSAYEAFNTAGNASKIKSLSLDAMFEQYGLGKLDPIVN